ncbi:MAG: hypothetical protein ACREK5_04305 [Gemmatimonadota bacterium]
MAELRLPQISEPGEMVASLIVSGWLLDGTPGGLALDLDGRDEEGIVAELADRLRALTPARGAAGGG